MQYGIIGFFVVVIVTVILAIVGCYVVSRLVINYHYKQKAKFYKGFHEVTECKKGEHDAELER